MIVYVDLDVRRTPALWRYLAAAPRLFPKFGQTLLVEIKRS